MPLMSSSQESASQTCLQQLSASAAQSITCNCESPATKSKRLIETKAVPASTPNLFMWHHWETSGHYIEIQAFYKSNYLTIRLLLFYVRSVKARLSSSPQSLWFYFLISCCLSFPLLRPIANDVSFSLQEAGNPLFKHERLNQGRKDGHFSLFGG